MKPQTHRAAGLFCLWCVCGVSALADEPLDETPEASSPVAEEGSASIAAQLEALKVQLAQQQAQLAQQQAILSEMDVKGQPDTEGEDKKPTLEFDLEGYYWARGSMFNPYFDRDEGVSGHAALLRHHLRLRPTVRYGKLATFTAELRGLDNVVWGDNQSLASTSLFAGSPSNTGVSGSEVPSIQLTRAWMEFTLPVGLLRIGRQPSQWGMGLLANDGYGFDTTFGEKTNGSTVDRIVFATRPIAIGQAIAGKEDTEIPLIVAVGVDRLVEDPLIQYYGYTCSPGINQDVEGYNPSCDSNGDGVTDMDHGYTSDFRTEDNRGSNWWAEAEDDVMEVIYVLMYKGEDVDFMGPDGALIAGTYVVSRSQKETDSDVLVIDAYLKARSHGVQVEFEGVHIRGTTRAITLPGAYNSGGVDEDPLQKEANTWGYVARVGYGQDRWNAVLESGYASGDEDVADRDFTGRPLHPDHNVGLLLYEQVLARVTAEGWSEDAQGLWSHGGVYNSHYFFPQVTVHPMDDLDITAGLLVAWPDKPDGRFIRCQEGEGCSQARATASHLGVEFDLAVKAKLHKHVLLSLETGIAKVTDRIPLETAGLDENGLFFTLQTRAAFVF